MNKVKDIKNQKSKNKLWKQSSNSIKFNRKSYNHKLNN